jgi:hypothetical protein
MGMYTMLTPGDMPADCENCGTTHTAEDLDMRSCDHQCCQSCIDSTDEDCPICNPDRSGEHRHGVE